MSARQVAEWPCPRQALACSCHWWLEYIRPLSEMRSRSDYWLVKVEDNLLCSETVWCKSLKVKNLPICSEARYALRTSFSFLRVFFMSNCISVSTSLQRLSQKLSSTGFLIFFRLIYYFSGDCFLGEPLSEGSVGRSLFMLCSNFIDTVKGRPLAAFYPYFFSASAS